MRGAIPIKIPKNEILWLSAIDENGCVTYVITSDQHRAAYKLYEVDGDKLVYTKHKSSNPRDLDKWIWKG